MSVSLLRQYAGKVLRKLYAFVEPWIHRYPRLRGFIKSLDARLPLLRKALSENQDNLYRQLQSSRQRRLVLIDVSHMHKTGLHTGIQRVVRAILNEFNNIYSSDVDVEPVLLTCKGGYWHYHFMNTWQVSGTHEVVVPKAGDVFLGLDLNSQVINAARAGLFRDWQTRCAKIVFAVHDILPITHPHWWHEDVAPAHEDWLRTVLEWSDQVVSVSKATQDSLLAWADQQSIKVEHTGFEWFHLGADIENSMPSTGLPDSAASILEKLSGSPTFLMVGSLEPRKGHQQALESFEQLWRRGREVNLVIVGKQGWMIDELAQRIQAHPENGQQLFWLDGISDEYLEKVYAASTCLLSASEGEGFGLPLIEAARHGLPMLVRDLAICREVAGHHASYFTGLSADELCHSLEMWLDAFQHQKHIQSVGMPWQTWKQSAEELKAIIDG